MKHTFPDNYGEECIIIAFDKSLLPMIAGALRPFEKRYSWVSEEDYELGYNAFAQVQADMANNCLNELIESNNRLYRLLDTALNGTVYSATGDSPPVVTPAIPAAPPAEIGAAPGLRRQLEDARGILPGGFLGIGARPPTQADVVMALRAGSEGDIERVNTALDTLIGASSGATIFNTVRDLLTDTAELAGEGGILAVLIASTMSNAAMMGLQGAQLDTLIAALNRLIEQMGVPAAPAPEETLAGELGAIRDLLEPEEVP